MKDNDLLIIWVPADTTQPPELLPAVLPTHLARARGVTCEVVPHLVTPSVPGEAVLVRVEERIAFRPVLAPVRPVKVEADAEPAVVDA